jgi:BASS family bile acid:Na+ symporter
VDKAVHFREIYAYGVGTLFKMDYRQKRTLALQVGMQNAALGTRLAIDYIGPKAAIPTAFFIFVCIITAAIAAAIWQRSVPETRN